jgi:hypothetical protein
MMRGNVALDTSQALDILSLLVPIVEAAHDDSEACEAASSVISRMPRNDPAAAMIDWWFVVSTGGQTPLGWAYNLPDSIREPLRSKMSDVVAYCNSGLSVPVAQWLRETRSLAARLPAIEQLLDLDSYGKSKLPGEREVWAWFVAELGSTVEALRAGRAAFEFEVDHKQLSRELEHAEIDANSRRWNEIVKRVEECVTGINEIVRVQLVAAPWLQLPQAPRVDGVPSEAMTALGELAPVVFEPLVCSGRDWWRSQATHIAERLESIMRGLHEADASWLSAVVDGWFRAAKDSGLRIQMPLVEQMIARRNAIGLEITELRASGADPDDAELLLMEHDVSGAENAIRALKSERQLTRRADAMANKLVQFRRVGDDSQAVPANWSARLDEAESLLRGGEIDTAKRLIDALEIDLRHTRRADEIAELAGLRAELESLAAPPVVFTDLDQHLRALQDDPAVRVNTELQQRLTDRLVGLRAQRSAEVAELLSQIRSLLETAGESLAESDRSDFELRLAEIDHADASGDVRQTKELAAALFASIQDKRIYRWDSAAGERQLIDHVLGFCTQELDFDSDDVRRLYVAAKTKPFVILAGLTGSGKSTIARLFAAALGADATNGRYRRIAVRPDWIDQSDVLGMINPMSNRFEPGWLAMVARQCEQNLDQLHVVLLDEMNLAPVEQYLAEYLSALEEARSGHEATQLPLYNEGADPANRADWPPTLPFPRNLIVIGTVNVDETTRVLSDRVLDRANVLQLSVGMSDAHHVGKVKPVRPWYVPFSEWDAICVREPADSHHAFLVDIGEILQSIGIGVGARAHVELERFLANAAGVLNTDVALDLGVLQRIIPKIRGFKRDLAEGLEELKEALEKRSCERSARVVARWLDDSVSDDDFLDGTDARIGLLR